jgi:hypothetical protein
MRNLLVAILFLAACNSKGCESTQERALQRLGPDAQCIGGTRNYCIDSNVTAYCNANGKHWVCDCGNCIVVENFPTER